MAIIKRHWYHNFGIEFYLRIPFIRVQTALLREAFEYRDREIEICRVDIDVWKWCWSFNLYKRLHRD